VTLPIDTRGAELASEIARLHERLRPDAPPVDPSRNLFAFRAAAARRLPAPAPAPAPMPALSEALPQALAQPAFKLAGIAEDAGPDGPVRTAIISGEGQLFMVKEGESVTSRYRVVKILRRRRGAERPERPHHPQAGAAVSVLTVPSSQF